MTDDLTDLVGLDPNLTGGLDAAEYVARQNCGHGEELDRLRAQVQAVRDLHTGDWCCNDCGYKMPCPTIQALGEEA